MARPQETYDQYVAGVFERPRKLRRSATYTNLTYIKESEHEKPIRRSPSVSKLAPSHALEYDYRVPRRYITSAPFYQPDIGNWYLP